MKELLMSKSHKPNTFMEKLATFIVDKRSLFFLLAIFSNTLYYWAENTAITLTQTTNVSILVSTSPIMTALVLAALHKEDRLTRQQAVGFGIAFAGVVLVVFNGAVALHIQPTGDLLALVAAASWSAYGILAPLPMALAHGTPIGFASLFLWKNALRLLYLGLIGSALCHLLWSSCVQKLGVLKANLYLYMMPLATLVVSAMVLDETITLMGVAGIVLVIAGMILGTVPRKTSNP